MKILAMLLLFLCFLVAVSAETQEVVVNVSQVTGIVNVTSDIEFNKVLVGYEYKGKINVEWAIPPEALKGINEERVVVGVDIRRGPETKSITFLEDNESKEQLSFDLTCVVVGDKCSDNSTLKRSVPVLFIVKEDVSSLNTLVIVNATLKTFEKNSTSTGKASKDMGQEGQNLDTGSVLNTLRQNGVAIIAGIIALLLIIYLIKKI